MKTLAAFWILVTIGAGPGVAFAEGTPPQIAFPEEPGPPVALEIAPLIEAASDAVTTVRVRNPGRESAHRIIVTVTWHTRTNAEEGAASADTTLTELAAGQAAEVQLTRPPGTYVQRVVRVGVYGRTTLLTLFLPASTGPVNELDVLRTIATSVPPTVVKTARPTYPPVAAALNLQGQVPLAVSIGPSGMVRDVMLLSTDLHLLLLDTAAVNAVRQWEFTSAPPDAPLRTLKTSINFTLSK